MAYSEMQLLERWESRREIKNLMGKYTLDCLNKQEGTIVANHFSSREDISYGTNDGYYAGREAVTEYYQAVCAFNRFKESLIKDTFPKLKDTPLSQLEGAGVFDDRPCSMPVIEIAGDGQTAKGIWYCMGSNADVTSGGIASYWTWGYYTADFILEDGSWKFWHLVYENDIETLCGQTWTRENEPYPELESMKAVKDFDFPKPNVPVKLREPYTPRRKYTRTPRLPEPYTTFAETFSYGV